MMWCYYIAAYGECGVKDLVIGTVRSGRQIQGKPEWNVQIVNKCNCSQSNIFLSCQGFQTVEPVDPAIFSKHGDQCSVNKGFPIASQNEVTFSYAWDPPFFLFPLSTRSLSTHELPSFLPIKDRNLSLKSIKGHLTVKFDPS